MTRTTALDPMLGRVMLPGEHEINGVTYRIEADGGRVTGAALPDGRPEVWFMGCSWTFGSGEPEETTFPWLLQQRLPHLAIRNYAVPGYGTVQNLLDLKRRGATRRPAHVVFVYGEFHWKRNVPNLYFIKKFMAGDNRSLTHFQRGRLDRHGRLSIDVVEVKPELGRPRLGGLDERLVEPDEFTQVQVTVRLVEEAAAYAKGLGAGFALAHLTGANDPVLTALRAGGIPILDLAAPLASVPVEQRWNAAKHPSAAVQRAYAAALLPALSAVSAA
jgi:hypothetical protein